MSIRILGGFAKGLNLKVPDESLTRPTSVMLRRRLFDSLQNLEGKIFIDLFAGSGSVGLESLSRGAEEVYFIEAQKNPYLICKHNIELLSQKYKTSTKAKLIQMDSIKWSASNLLGLKEKFEQTIIFIDPPYENHQLYFDALEELKKCSFTGTVWIESDKLKGLKEEILLEYLVQHKKTFIQGDHFVLIGKLK